MKKILAVVLALVLALSCTLALAETSAVEEPVFQGLTVQSEYDVNREVLMSALALFGLDEYTIGIVDTVAAIVDEAGEKAVLAPDGFQYELLLKDTSLFNVVGQLSETGLVASTSLVPNYTFSVSMEEIGQALQSVATQAESLQALDTEALTQSITGYMNTFIDTCTAAVSYGDAEQGDYVLDGISYNVKVPINVDLAAILNGYISMFSALSKDEAVKSAIETLNGMGVNITLPEEGELSPVDGASLPTVAIDAYMYIDEEGNQSDTVDVVFSVTPAGSKDAATIGDVLIEGGNVRVIAQFLTAGLNVAYTVEKAENGGSARLDIDYNDIYVGFATVCDSRDDSTAVDGYIYLLDGENPVFTSHSTITLNGALTLSADGKGKTVVALSDLVNKNSKAMTGGIVFDFMFNGLGGLRSTLEKLMPDETGTVSNLIGAAQG